MMRYYHFIAIVLPLICSLQSIASAEELTEPVRPTSDRDCDLFESKVQDFANRSSTALNQCLDGLSFLQRTLGSDTQTSCSSSPVYKACLKEAEAAQCTTQGYAVKVKHCRNEVLRAKLDEREKALNKGGASTGFIGGDATAPPGEVGLPAAPPKPDPSIPQPRSGPSRPQNGGSTVPSVSPGEPGYEGNVKWRGADHNAGSVPGDLGTPADLSEPPDPNGGSDDSWTNYDLNDVDAGVASRTNLDQGLPSGSSVSGVLPRAAGGAPQDRSPRRTGGAASGGGQSASSECNDLLLQIQEYQRVLPDYDAQGFGDAIRGAISENRAEYDRRCR